MKDMQTVRRHVLLVVLLICLGGGWAGAQGRARDPYAGLTRCSFKYSDKDIRDNVIALCSIPPSAMDEVGRFRLSYYLREWETVRDTLRKMTPATAGRVYGKMVFDLTRERAPVMTVDDFYGLLDACPTAPNDAMLDKLGNLARVIVRPEEKELLGTRLELGTAFFGGKDFTKRFNLGRVMLQADFDDLALRFLPGPSDMKPIKDETVHREILQFHKIREELAGGKRAGKTVEQLTKEFTQVTEAFFGDVASRNPAAAAQLTTECLERWARLNDPIIPEEVRKQFKITESQIVVTPIVAARNLQYYADLMALMRKNKVSTKEMGYLLDVYERSQSVADVYRRDELEKVFGPITSLDEASFTVLIERMRGGLGGRWRTVGVHDGAKTLAMVRVGYAMAIKMVDDWAGENTTDWKSLRFAAVMASDWADFEYFQDLARSPKRRALALYDEKNKLSQEYFGKAAERYLKAVETSVTLVETEETLFVTWFKHLMGFNSNGDINLSKAASRGVLQEIRDMINSLPEGAAQAQTAALSAYVDRMTGDPKALHPNMKFKFMESALIITADTSFSEATSNKVEYLETLLEGVQLETRIDGPNTIWRKEDVGIVVSLRHTDVMGRQIKFESILGAAAARKPTDKARKMMASDTVRNDLESEILEVLAPFFDVRSITLSPTTVKPRPTKEPGWERTVLAYVVVRARDVSVDEIPQLTLDLNFLDKRGPVTLPVRSAVRVIQMKEGRAKPRKVDDLRLTQTIDTRKLKTTGELKLTVTAFGTGLMPRLSDLVDLRPLEKSIKVRQVVLEEGPVVREILSWSEDIEVTSERRWRVELDGERLVKARTQLPVYYPVPHAPAAVVRNDYYVDADVVVATNVFALVGDAEEPELVKGADGQFKAVDGTARTMA